MTPQRKQALVFFFFMVAVAIGILAWNFRLNRGAIAIHGDYPFIVSIGQKKNIPCINDTSCRFSLAPKKYNLTAQKKDYFNLETNLTIKRWRTTAKELKFEFKPKIQILGAFHAPTIDLSKIKLPPHGEIVPANNEAAFFFLGSKATKDQKLYVIKKGDINFETIVQFQRALINSRIYLSAKNDYAIIQETLASSESKFYLVNIGGKTKKRITLPESVQGVRLLTGNRIVYDLLENGKRIVRSRYLKNGEVAAEDVALDAINALGVGLRDNVNDTTVIYVSENPPEELEKRISIFKAVDLAKENLEALQKPAKTAEKNEKKWYFVEFNFETGAEKLLATFEHAEKENFLLSDIAAYGAVLRFTTEKEGEKIHHQLLLAPQKNQR